MNRDIPVIILCGGQGTRIRDVNENIPKPMLPIGEYPMLWHIMRIYASHGYTTFILALGYKSWVIKEYFLNYRVMSSDFTLELASPREVRVLNHHQPLDWRITFVETGESSQTGRRIHLCSRYLESDEFMVTYGDGVADIDVAGLHSFHRQHGRIGTVTGVRPSGRFGAMAVEASTVVEFSEKKPAGGGLINGGFFVFKRSFLDILAAAGDSMLESEPLNELVRRRELQMFLHDGFWEPMDTLREYLGLNRLWAAGQAPWKIWG